MKPNTTSNSLRHSLALISALLAMAGSSSQAANSTWSGGTSTAWATAGNWSPAAPTAANTAQFSSTYTNQPTLGTTAASVGGVYATTGLGQDVTISGTGAGVLTIAGNLAAGTGPGTLANVAIQLDDSANHNLTITAPVAITNSTSILTNNTGTITLNGGSTNGLTITAAKALTLGGTNASGSVIIASQIANTSGSIVINGLGKYTLSGNNLYTGGTTITAGTLVVGSATALGASTNTLSGTGGTLDLNGISITTSLASSGTYGGGITNNGGSAATLTLTNSSFGILNGVISDGTGATAISYQGLTSYVTINGTNTYSGGTTIGSSAGSVFSVRNSTSTAFGTGPVTIFGGIAIGGGASFSNAVTLDSASSAPTAAITESGSTTWSGAVTIGTATNPILNVSGSGSTGAISGVIGGAAGYGLTYAADNTDSYSNKLALSGNNTFTGGLTLQPATNWTSSITAVLNNAGALGVGGTFTIGANNGVGTTNLDAGSAIVLANGNAQVWNGDFSFLGTANLTFGTGAISLGSTAQAMRTVNVGVNTLTEGGVISDGTNGTTPTKTLAKAGAGTLVLNGVDTYSGGTVIFGGTLTTGNAGALGSTTAPVTLSAVNGATLSLGTTSQTVGSLNAGITTPTYTGGTGYTVAPTVVISGGGGTGATGTFAISNNNSNNGVLVFTLTNPGTGYTSTPTITIVGGATSGTAATITAVAPVSTATLTDSVAVNTPGTLTIGGTNSTPATFYGFISGTGAVVKNGTGTQIFAGANTYSGATTVNTGILEYLQNPGASATLGGSPTTVASSSAALEIQGSFAAGGGALTLNGTGGTAGANGALENLSGTSTYSGLVTLGSSSTIYSDAGTLTISNAGTITGAGFGLTVGGAGNSKITSIIGTGAGTLTKSNGGTLTLSGASTYTGGTAINGGTLIATVPLALGAITGTNNVSIANGATLLNAPTASGTLTLGSQKLNIASGGIIADNVSTSTGPITNGGIVSTGAATTTGTYTVEIVGTGAAVSATPFTQTLASAASGLNGGTPTLVALNASNFTLGTFTHNGTTLSVVVTGVTALTNEYWNGGFSGGNSVWALSDGSTASNWATNLGGTATSLTPGATTTVTFSDTTPSNNATSTTLGSNMSVAGIVVNDTNGVGLNADGNTLTIGTGGIVDNSGAGAVTISTPVVLGAAQPWTNNSSNTLTVGASGTAITNATFTITTGGTGATTIAGNLSGTGGLTMAASSGTLTLSGADTYTGTTTFGTNDALTISSTGSLIGGGALTINSGNTLTLNGQLAPTAVITVAGGTLTEGSTGVIGSTAAAALNITSGTVTLSGTNSYAGTTVVNSTLSAVNGTVTAAGTLNLTTFTGSAANSNITVATGATVNVSSASGTPVASVQRGNTLSLAGGNALTVTGTSAGNTNDVFGNLLLASGDNPISNISIVPNAGKSAALTFNGFTRGIGAGLGFVNGTKLGFAAPGTAGDSNFLLGSTASATALMVGSTTVGATGGASGSAKNLGIIPFLTGEASTTAGTGGTATGIANTFLTYDSTTGLRPLDPVNEYSSATTLTVANNNRVVAGGMTSAGTQSANSLVLAGGSLAIGGTLTDASGAVLITTSNNITGGTLTNATAPIYLYENGGALSSTVSSLVTQTGTSNNSFINIGSTSNLTLSGGWTTSPTITQSGNAYVTGGGQLNLTGGVYAWASNGYQNDLRVGGPGTVVNYTGGSFGNYFFLNLSNGAVFDVNNGSGLQISGLNNGVGANPGSGTIKLTSGNFKFTDGGGSSSSTTITGGGGMTLGNTFVGIDTWAISGNNNFAGGLTIQPGTGSADTLKLGGGSTLSDTGGVTLISGAVNSGAILDTNNSSETIGSLNASTVTGTALVANSGNNVTTLTINTTEAGNGNYAGGIVARTPGNLSLTKTGIGTQTLTGTALVGSAVTPTLATAVAALANSNTLVLSSTAGMVPFQAISGTGITAGTYITFVNGTTIGLSSPTNGTAMGVGITITGTAINPNYAGTTTVNNGTLALDLSTNTTGVISSSSNLVLGGGTLKVSGKNTGTSSQSLGTLSLTASTGSGIVLNNNSGSGTTLTLGSSWTRGTNATLNINTASGGTLTSSPTLGSSGILPYATVTDATSTGFAVVTSGNVVRYTGATAGLPSFGSSGTTNYAVTTSPSALTGNENIGSLAVNTTAGSTITIDGGGGNILGINSGGLLQTGGGNSVFTGGIQVNNGSELIVQQYGTGTMTFDSSMLIDGDLTVAGTGTVVLQNNTEASSYAFATHLNGGVVNFVNGSLASGAITFGGGTLQYATGNTFDITSQGVTTSGAGATIDTNGNPVSFASAITGNGGLSKVGTGTLTLSALNTYTGDTTVGGGTLLLDLGTNTTGVIASNSALIGQGGTLNVQGKSSGTSSQTLGGLAAVSGDTHVVVNNNGGTGTTLTINNTWVRSPGATVNFNLSSSAGNVLQTQTVSNTNGIISGGITLTDSTGTGFAFYNDTPGTVTNPIQRYTSATTTLPGTGSSATTNYALSASSTVSASESVNSLALNTSGGAVTLGLGSGNNLTITSGGILQTGSSAGAITGTGTLGATGSEVIVNQYGTGTGATLSVGNPISGGAGSLTKSGPGELILTGTSLYTGATNVNSGRLTVTGALSTSSAVNVFSGATLSGTGTVGATNIASGGAINLTETSSPAIGTLGAGALTINAGGGTSLTFDINGSLGTVDKIASTGTLTIGGTGAITINLNTLTPGTGLAAGSYTIVSYTGGPLSASAFSDFSFTGGASSVVIDGKTFTLANNTGALALSVAGAGATNGQYRLATTAGSLNVHAGGGTTTLSTTFTNTGTGSQDTLNYSGLTAAGTGVGTASGTTSGSTIGLGASGTGSASNTFTGGTAGNVSVSATATVTNSTALGTPSASNTPISINVYSGLSTWSTNGNGDWGTLTTGFGTNWGVSSNQGSPGVTSGFLNTDTATFDNSVLTVGSSATVSLNGATPSVKAITFNTTGGSSYTIAQGSSGKLFLLGNAGDATVTDSNGSNSITAPVEFDSGVTASVTNSGDTLTLSGAITQSGTQNFTKTGAGKVILGTAAGYTGTTTVSGGTLQNGIANAVNSSSSVILNGGTWDVNSFNNTVAGVSLQSGSITGTSGVLTSSSNYDVRNGTISSILAGSTGSIGLTKTTTSTVTLSGSSANTYAGTTSVNDGELDLNKSSGVAVAGNLVVGDSIGAANSAITKLLGSNQIATSSAVTINSDGKFDLNGNSNTVASVTSNGGTITGGTVTTTAAPSFTGTGNTIASGATVSSSLAATVATGASLAVNGTLSTGSVSVGGSGGLLNGTGTVGSVSLASGSTLGGSLTTGPITGSGTIAPGNSPGILTATSTAVGTGGANFKFEMTSTTGPTYTNPLASGNDVLHLTDATAPIVGVANGSNVFDIYFNTLTLAVGNSFVGGIFTDKNSNFYTLISGGTYNYYVAVSSGATTTYNGQGYETLAAYNNLISVSLSAIPITANFGSGPISGFEEQFAVVPEPGTWALMLGGLVALVVIQRRRKQN